MKKVPIFVGVAIAVAVVGLVVWCAATRRDGPAGNGRARPESPSAKLETGALSGESGEQNIVAGGRPVSTQTDDTDFSGTGAAIEGQYSVAVLALHLPDAQLRRLGKLLEERRWRIREAHDEGVARHFTSKELGQACKLAAEPSEQEMRALLVPANYARVEQMLKEGIEHGLVQSEYVPAMQAAGVELSPDQAWNLAEVMYRNLRQEFNPAIGQLRRTVLDEGRGLSVADESVLAQTASFLTTRQQAVLAERLRLHTALLRGPHE